jgi:chromosome segregation ATPase
MHLWFLQIVSVLLVAAGAALGWSQDEPPAVEPKPPAEVEQPADDDPPASAEKPADPAKAEIAALIAQQNALADEYNAILRGIKQQEDVAALEQELAEIKQALAKAEAGDPDLAEARGAQRAAIKARQKLIEQKISEHPEGGKALAQLKRLQAEKAAFQWDAALAQFQLDSPLSPINRALAGDDELAELQASIKAAATEDRLAAQAAYQKRRKEKIAALEEGQTLLAELEEATASADKLLQTIVLVEERLAPIRKQIEESTSADVAEAQAAVNSALEKGSIKELRERQTATIEKYNARVKELIAADPKADTLKAEYEALGKQIRDMKKEAAKPASGER